MASLTPRGRDQRWLSTHRGLTEQPPGSNTDTRADGIRTAQKRFGAWLVGAPWCGVWAANALLAAGVQGVTWRLASVALIEDDAKAGSGPFRDWKQPGDSRWVLRGDLAVMFGRGVHVATVRRVDRKRGIVITDEGNTSSGPGGSQSNGGGSFRRIRALSDVRGFARVDYPGGTAARLADRVAQSFATEDVEETIRAWAKSDIESSDDLLFQHLEGSSSYMAQEAIREIEQASARWTKGA